MKRQLLARRMHVAQSTIQCAKKKMERCITSYKTEGLSTTHGVGVSLKRTGNSAPLQQSIKHSV